MRTTQESWNVLSGTSGKDEQFAISTLADGGAITANTAGGINSAVAAKTQIAALVSLTDSTGGTVDNTVAAVPAATAAVTDVTAASLTSTNTSLTAIKNDLADLTGKVNAVIAALKA